MENNNAVKDGDELGNGIVFSSAGGFFAAVYRCKCGREQTAEHVLFSGGINRDCAEQLGWTFFDVVKCPFCAGNIEKLRKLFDVGSDD
jgi:hypothetical protein